MTQWTLCTAVLHSSTSRAGWARGEWKGWRGVEAVAGMVVVVGGGRGVKEGARRSYIQCGLKAKQRSRDYTSFGAARILVHLPGRPTCSVRPSERGERGASLYCPMSTITGLCYCPHCPHCKESRFDWPKGFTVDIFDWPKGFTVDRFDGLKGFTVDIFDWLKGFAVDIFDGLKGFAVDIFANRARVAPIFADNSFLLPSR